MLRTPLSWLVVFALLVAGFGATVLALNADVFSAHGFVRSYLQALQRKDADEALAFAGMVVPESENATLLVDGALGDIGDIRLLSDVASGDTHVVRFAYEIDGNEEITEFHVQPDGSTLALFARWRFAVAPLARIEVAVESDARFTANGVEAVTGSPLLVLAPGAYVIDRDTDFLAAESATAAVTTVGDTEQVGIEVGPTQAFETAAAEAVDAYLDQCVTQAVLMPSSCPFGFSEANRIDGVPTWSVVDYPQVDLAATDEIGIWRAIGVNGAVRISVTVKSIFDGSTSNVTRTLDVDGSYLISLGADESITVLEASA